MSFSGDVKRELSERIGKSRHCQLAELAAILAFSENPFGAENSIISSKLVLLGRELFGDDDIAETDLQEKAYEAVKMWDGECGIPAPSDVVRGTLIQQSCCRRAYIRGAFLAAGSISDPNKSYHFEIVCATLPQAVQLRDAVNSFDVDSKIVARKKSQVVYVKEGEQIVDLLNVMEAYEALMNLENVRILKDMRNSVNRRVNCETANIGKTVGAAVRQIEDIEYIRDGAGLGILPENLRETALVRLDYPDATLEELGAQLHPPVGKSGVNHRLRRISVIASELRGKS